MYLTVESKGISSPNQYDWFDVYSDDEVEETHLNTSDETDVATLLD